MSVTFAPFITEHLSQLTEIQTEQRDELTHADVAEAQRAERDGLSVTAFHRGRAVACGGIIVNDAGFRVLWGLFSAAAGPWMLSMVREINRILQSTPNAVVLTTVREDFAAGVRLLRILGFEADGSRRSAPDGTTHLIFGRFTYSKVPLIQRRTQ